MQRSQEETKEEHYRCERLLAHCLVLKSDEITQAGREKDGKHANGRPSRKDCVGYSTEYDSSRHGSHLEERQDIRLRLLLIGKLLVKEKRHP